jgi:hypothetical protein
MEASMNTPETVSAEYGDALMTVEQFATRYPHLYPKPHRVRWLLRDRTSNGLLDRGAVVEVFANGPRPTLFIHAPNWFAWMRAGGSHAPRRNP